MISQTVQLLPLFLPASFSFPPLCNIAILLRLRTYLRPSDMNYEEIIIKKQYENTIRIQMLALNSVSRLVT
jgi:hypothetical protein